MEFRPNFLSADSYDSYIEHFIIENNKVNKKVTIYLI